MHKPMTFEQFKTYTGPWGFVSTTVSREVTENTEPKKLAQTLLQKFYVTARLKGGTLVPDSLHVALPTELDTLGLEQPDGHVTWICFMAK